MRLEGTPLKISLWITSFLLITLILITWISIISLTYPVNEATEIVAAIGRYGSYIWIFGTMATYYFAVHPLYMNYIGMVYDPSQSQYVENKNLTKPEGEP